MARWAVELNLDAAGSHRPMFERIALSITAEILRGRLRPGTALPGSRTLAEQLSVSRQTVVTAYDTLVAEGWLKMAPASGTFVADTLPQSNARRPRGRRRTSAASPLTVHSPPETVDDGFSASVDLSSGQPDLSNFPIGELSRAWRRALRLQGHQLLGYRDPTGHPRLRAALAQMVSATRGLPAAPSNVLITAGSQMAWTLLTRALATPGQRIAVESLGYRPAWEAMSQSGAGLVPIPLDDKGIDIEALASAAATGRLAAVYLTPHRQYPTTVTLAADRRLALLDLAEEHDFAVIEDDYDHEFHYGSRPVPPIASLDSTGRVAYVGTLSKIFAPGLRLGFVVAAPTVIQAAARHRAILDLHGDHVLEAAVAELLEDGIVQRHANRLRSVYAKRRTLMLRALHDELGDVLSPVPSDGGLGIWCPVTSESDVDVGLWSTRCAAGGLHVRTSRDYAFADPVAPALRLSFAPIADADIAKTVRLLAEACPIRSR